MSSNHRRAALAIGGLLALVALAKAEQLLAGTIGGARGQYIAALAAMALFSGCGLAHSLRQYRPTPIARPAPVRLPERAADDLEPAATS